MKQARTPQDKKLLSYKKDRRNSYGERGSHSRYAIARQKACSRRIDRHKADHVLKDSADQPVELLDDLDLKVKGIRRRRWHKYPDQPLAIVLQHKFLRRVRMGINRSIKTLLKPSNNE